LVQYKVRKKPNHPIFIKPQGTRDLSIPLAHPPFRRVATQKCVAASPSEIRSLSPQRDTHGRCLLIACATRQPGSNVSRTVHLLSTLHIHLLPRVQRVYNKPPYTPHGGTGDRSVRRRSGPWIPRGSRATPAFSGTALGCRARNTLASLGKSLTLDAATRRERLQRG